MMLSNNIKKIVAWSNNFIKKNRLLVQLDVNQTASDGRIFSPKKPGPKPPPPAPQATVDDPARLRPL